jgi:hypothetical protein
MTAIIKSSPMIIAAMIAASHQRPNSRNTMMLAETSVEFR